MLLEALKNIYHRRYDPDKEIDGLLFEEVNRIINHATDTSFPDSVAGGDFLQQLRTNNGVFAAFKTHRMGRDMAGQLLDKEGTLKTFRQFQEDVQHIASHHVDAWLRTEYNTAIKRGHRAAEWRQFLAEADVLPNLEWLPSTALHPRESHMPFYHHIWPIDDPFWTRHKPGDEWGCQCSWVATAEPPTDNTGLGEALIKPSPGLEGDPAQAAQIFSDDHPYFPSNCDTCPFKTVQLSLFTNRVKDCYHCKNILRAILKAKTASIIEEYKRLKADPNYLEIEYDKKSGGLSATHKEHRFDPTKGIFGIQRGEYERWTVDVLRKRGHKIILASEQAADGVKCPDGFLNDVVMDIKAIEGTGRYTIKNKFDSACRQQAECIVLYFHDKTMFSEEKVRRGWQLYLGDLRSKQQIIKKIVCVVGDEVVEFIP